MEKYTLKNFRVFKEQGGTVNIAPLTVLTGCNSSGKSSVVKSLMLLNPYMSKIKQDIRDGKFGDIFSKGRGFSSYNLDLARGKHKLGNFDRVVNWDSDDDTFTTQYTVKSYALCDDIEVCLKWGKDGNQNEGQALNAKLLSATISCDDEVFFKYSSDISSVKILKFKDKLIRLLQWIEMGNLVNSILAELNAPIIYRFDETSLESVKEFLGENTLNYVYGLYKRFERSNPTLLKDLCKKFNLSNFKFLEGSRKFDWEKSVHTHEFEDNNLISLRSLSKELDACDKNTIVEYTKNRFIDQIGNVWYNTDKYKQRIVDIFSDFKKSDFEHFSEYYSNLETECIKSISVEFGVDDGGGRLASYLCLLWGTAQDEYAYINWNKKSWDELSGWEKFEELFMCLQVHAGYVLSIPDTVQVPSDELDAVIKAGILVCSEAFSSCELLTDVDFMEIDRSNAQRIYTYSEQGTSFNTALDNYYNLDNIVRYKGVNGEQKEYTKGTFTSKWLKKLTSYDGFSLVQAPEGVGYYVYVMKKTSSGDEKKVTLTDVGYGTTPLLSMLIRLEILICNYWGKTETITVCIEEPESNLHPNLQSLLADMFADIVSEYDIRIILETHSEYLIRKLQVLVSKGVISRDIIALHYVEKSDEAEKSESGSVIRFIPIAEDGQLLEQFGSGFLDEAINNYQQLEYGSSEH